MCQLARQCLIFSSSRCLACYAFALISSRERLVKPFNKASAASYSQLHIRICAMYPLFSIYICPPFSLHSTHANLIELFSECCPAAAGWLQTALSNSPQRGKQCDKLKTDLLAKQINKQERGREKQQTMRRTQNQNKTKNFKFQMRCDAILWLVKKDVRN